MYHAFVVGSNDSPPLHMLSIRKKRRKEKKRKNRKRKRKDFAGSDDTASIKGGGY
jgi:hypothetical protein